MGLCQRAAPMLADPPPWRVFDLMDAVSPRITPSPIGSNRRPQRQLWRTSEPRHASCDFVLV